MPYIKQEDRKKIDEEIEKLIKKLKALPEDKIDGTINYAVTRIIKSLYLPSYFNYNRAVGVLECIKQEFYRREISEYENKKIKENGDVT